MSNILGLGVSFLFVGAVIGGASLLHLRFKLTSSVTRKLIHISVSNWWLILMAFFDSLAYAVIGPICFIAVNAFSVFRKYIPAMEQEGARRHFGTVYFPVSLLILVLLSFTGRIPLYAGAAGVLIMGYGDGLAALLGEYFGRRTFVLAGNKKSIVGTATMAAVSFVISYLIILACYPQVLTWQQALGAAAAVAVFAAGTELITPKGLDNLTVPVGTALFFTGMLEAVHW